MKQSLKFILAAICSVIVILIAVFGYNALIKMYNQAQNPPSNESSGSKESESSDSSVKSTDAVTDESKNESESQTENKIAAIDFTVIDKDGNAVSLSEFFGKPIIVNFWATWCGPCKSELPEFNNAYAEYGNNITFLMVNLTDGYRDTVSGVKSFVENGGYNFPVYFDTENSASDAYSIYSIPYTVIIDKNGNIVNTHLGSMDNITLANYIDALMKSE